jgi:tetratricopeptide (TPR) repeat protein
VAILRRIGDKKGIAASLNILSWGLDLIGRRDAAAALADELFLLLETAELTGSFVHANALRIHAGVAAHKGALETARSYMRKAIEIFTFLGADRDVLRCYAQLAEFDFIAGDPDAAIKTSEKVLDLSQRLAARIDEMYMRCNRSEYHLSLGNVDAARDDATAALKYGWNNDVVCTLTAMQHLASVAALKGDAELSARLIGFVDAERIRVSLSREVAEKRSYHFLVEKLAVLLESDAIVGLALEGSSLMKDEAFELALSV